MHATTSAIARFLFTPALPALLGPALLVPALLVPPHSRPLVPVVGSETLNLVARVQSPEGPSEHERTAYLVKNKECCVLNVQAAPATYLALSKVYLSPLVHLPQTRTPIHSTSKHR